MSGRLIMNTLVMYDHQTRTLWAQSLNRAVDGPLAGAKLDFVPVTHTTWSFWQEAHPDTIVLNERSLYRTTDSYNSYYRNPRSGIFGEAIKDDRLKPKDLVVGVQVDNNFKAYPFEALREQPLVGDKLAGQGLLVYFDRGTDTALVYLAEVDGLNLTFRLLDGGDGLAARLMDNETGSTWMAVTGTAINGELKGKTLKRALAHLSFWFAWKDWNPETELYEG